MTASTGRDFIANIGGTPIAGMQTTSVSFDGSPVDITSKDDNGFRTLASFAGTKSLDLTGEGVVKDEILRKAALEPDATLLISDLTIDFASGDSISGDFYLSGFEQTGEHSGEERYSVTYQSSGEWVYTDAV